MAKRESVFFESVQYLRGFAAFLVLLAHMPAGLPMAWNGAFRGGIGVDLFFIISGFVMAFTIEREGQGVRAALNFALRRCLRILPLYAIATLVLAAVRHFQGEPWPDSKLLIESVSTLPMSAADGSYEFPYLFLGWSLSYEMFFYVILVILLSLRRASWQAVASVLAVFVAVGVVIHPVTVMGSFITAPILLEFALGFFAYALWRQRAKQIREAKWLIWVASVIFLVALKGFDGDPVGAMPKMIITYFGGAPSWRSVGWGLPAFLLFMGFLSLEGRFHPRSQASLKTMGDISYSLYLFHMPVIHLLLPILGVSSFALTFVYLGVPILVSWVIYRTVEQPLMRATKALRIGGTR